MLATIAVIAVQQVARAGSVKENGLGDLSLEELLQLRENILEAKQNLTYYIEESDDEDEDDDDNGNVKGEEDENGNLDDVMEKIDEQVHLPQKVDDLLNEPKEKTANEQKTTEKKKKIIEELPTTTENLLALREGLIAEIQEHMMNRTSLDDGIE